MKKSITHFETNSIFLSEFSQSGNGTVTKDALLMVEGNLPDSKGRPHNFTPERLTKIASNSNGLVSKGVKIPLVLEHEKTASATVGNLNDSNFYVKELTEEDVKRINPRALDLIGKTALFAKNILVKTPEIVTKVLDGTASSVSMGLDLLTEAIREVSLVGIPSYEYASLFSKYGRKDKTASFALTWDDDFNRDALQEMEEKYEEFSEQCWDYLANIYNANEAELEGRDPSELINETLYGFVERVKSLLGISVADENMNSNPINGAPLAPNELATDPNEAKVNTNYKKYTVMANFGSNKLKRGNKKYAI